MYLDRVQTKIADAFDYAINVCHFSGFDFCIMFSASSIALGIENGDPCVMVGRSGIEYVMDIVRETLDKEIEPVFYKNYSRSTAYWIGWAVAYYQWHSGKRFMDIFNCITYKELERMYPIYHEMDITQFVDAMDEITKTTLVETVLKSFRKENKLTQEELARESGVSLRSIQMYEQRQKDINKASAETLKRLATVLGCSMENLLEKE